ncbi:hypothetical protein [Stigmatella aurantiaca]|uniref:Uncharacterized protein n=1 Tax=Stigmatella aurantiaca (strain DW4/3-1) TaxID=378806 RepID=Q08UB6_STIAD|nr:hypothetical protein [Stigmatella aurantiaca]ADO69131.1 uncharacterized protein STAUR_1327 [Stigmatella aurantiaca DW4/3-1]EAU64069.1 hypothetical protein STIAU_0047 [Stigmatella aurantiaca DW4/3-1]
MVCSFCQHGECINPAHAMPTPPARDARGWPVALGLRSVWRRLIEEHCIDLSDPSTLEKVNEIYYRSGGENFGSGTDALWTHKRAAGGELHTAIRYSREFPQDERRNILIRFIREVRIRGSRTPDFLVLHLGEDAVGPEHVEVRTLTQAKQQARVQRSKGGTHKQPLVLSSHAIERKLFYGQIGQQTPGVIVFHLPFAPLDGNALRNWQALLDGIRQRKVQFPMGLYRIEVTTGTHDATTNTRRMFVFEHARQWQGYVKDQYR